MSIYKYKCKHTECTIYGKDVRICKECDMVILTDYDIPRDKRYEK